MHSSVQVNHFNHALWVAVRCEASEAMPAAAVASKATCTYDNVNVENGELIIKVHTVTI